MSEFIRISNFGGIKEMEMELKPINVIIGPQASGKSVTAKLLYFFKSFFSDVFEIARNEESKRELTNRQMAKFFVYFPKDAWPNNDFKIEYQINELIITIENSGKKTIKITYSQEIHEIIENTLRYFKAAIKEAKDHDESFLNQRKLALKNLFKYYFEELSNLLPDHIVHRQLFIPAGRSFFASVQSSVFSILNANQALDPFLIEFGSFYEGFKNYSLYRHGESYKEQADLEALVSEILSGKHIREKGKDYLIHTDSRRVNLLYASSGQQEILPLILILKSLLEERSDDVGTLYIEEPEAHLFPIAQKRVLQLLARTSNARSKAFQIFVTTHSPYILAAFNNLMEAGKILDEKGGLADEISAIIPREEAISPANVAAYSLINGVKTDLIDASTKLISQNILDSVSDEISIEFGKLLDLEF